MSDELDILKQTFLEEAAGYIETLETRLMDLNDSDDQDFLTETLQEIFRAAHSLKGSSASVGFDSISNLTHKLEELIVLIQNDGELFGKDTVTVMLEAVDTVSLMLECQSEDKEAPKEQIDNLLLKLEGEILKMSSGRNTTSPIADPTKDTPAGLHLFEDEPASEPADRKEIAKKTTRAANVEKSITIHSKDLEILIDQASQLNALQDKLKSSISDQDQELTNLLRKISKLGIQVRNKLISVQSLPPKNLLQKLRRTVLDTANQLGKEIDFVIPEQLISIDKSILEALSDPLLHIVRNAVDHGIEQPAERESLGKPRTGRIEIDFTNRGSKLLITVTDDGRGLNRDQILQKALQKGLVAETVDLTEEKILDLVFSPGFSTKEVVSNISGRGVGMDVVKSNITRLQGSIHLESKFGSGTCMTIALPQNLSLVDSVIFTINNETYLAPKDRMIETLVIRPDKLQKNDFIVPYINYKGHKAEIFDTSAVLTGRPISEKANQVFIYEREGVCFGLMAEDIVGTKQVIKKNLDQYLSSLRLFGGCAILDNGSPSLIIDPVGIYDVLRNTNQEAA